MSVILRKNWWSLVIRGFAAILLGVLAVAKSGMSVESLARFYFVYALVDGLVGIAGAIGAAEKNERWTSLLLEGLASIVAAVAAVGWSVSFVSLAYVIGAWALITGVLEMISARRLRRHIAGEWLLASSGVASLVLGILMIALPLAGPAPVAVWLGAYSFIFGIFLITLGFRLQPRRPRLRLSGDPYDSSQR
jgi:uncharacterized membrane protein HdeD (DUF308 family)